MKTRPLSRSEIRAAARRERDLEWCKAFVKPGGNPSFMGPRNAEELAEYLKGYEQVLTEHAAFKARRETLLEVANRLDRAAAASKFSSAIKVRSALSFMANSFRALAKSNRDDRCKECFERMLDRCERKVGHRGPHTCTRGDNVLRWVPKGKKLRGA